MAQGDFNSNLFDPSPATGLLSELFLSNIELLLPSLLPISLFAGASTSLKDFGGELFWTQPPSF